MLRMVFDSLSGLVNNMTGAGTSRDKTTHARWHVAQADFQQLANAYRMSWICKKGVNIPAFDMFREGWRWQVDDKDAARFETEEKRLRVLPSLYRAMCLARLYGGAVMILDTSDADLMEPLAIERIGRGGLRRLPVLSRLQCVAGDLDFDVMSPTFQMPRYYEVTGFNSRSVRLHPSRVIRFIGAEMPDEALFQEDTWGDSVLTSALDVIEAASTAPRTMHRLMTESTVTYHRMKGLLEAMATDDGTEKVRRVIQLSEQLKSAVNAVAIDADQSVEQFHANFAGIPETHRELLQTSAAAFDVPLTRFLGMSPGGLNATGESDSRNYYDRLASEQTLIVDPVIEPLSGALIQSTLGVRPDGIRRDWNPLWQMSEKEQAEVDSSNAATLQVYANMGHVPDRVMAKITRAELAESPSFTGAAQAYSEEDALGLDMDEEPDTDAVAQANRLQAADPE